jgi:hypothetical protein
MGALELYTVLNDNCQISFKWIFGNKFYNVKFYVVNIVASFGYAQKGGRKFSLT